MAGKPPDLVGKKFGKLTVVRQVENRGLHCQWLCVCDCGGEKFATTMLLRCGDTKSCGCLPHGTKLGQVIKHGHAARGHQSPEYRVWAGMVKRCTNPHDRVYHHYGGKGISVCREWANDFSRFLADMGPRPSSQHTIGRLDHKKGYSPDNCVWQTWSEQSRCSSRANLLTLNGVTRCAKDWAASIGIHPDTIYKRIKRGWSVDKILVVARGKA